MIEKRLIVVNGLTGQEMPVKVEEGTTPEQLLDKLGLQNYQLARVSNRKVLPENCDVARTVEDRERLFAFAPMVVGCGL